MEPLTLLAGVVTALASFGLGHLNGRRRKLSETPRAVCEGCEHGLSYHDDDGKCHVTELVKQGGAAVLGYTRKQSPCTCQQYVGPIPADRMLASFTSPESPVRTDTQ